MSAKTSSSPPPPHGATADTFPTRLRRLFARENLPRSRAARIAIGIVLVLGGMVGFLPILGFWMVPMGLAILAIDIPAVRRFTRRASVFLKRLWNRFQA